MLSRLIVPLALTIALVLVSPVGLVLAQIDPQVRDRIVPAVVQIALIVDVTENGKTESQFLPVGSGTIISPDGLILTNHHVIDMEASQAELDAWEAQTLADGDSVTFSLDTESVLILGTTGVSRPEPLYEAQVVADDPQVDLPCSGSSPTPLASPWLLAQLTCPMFRWAIRPPWDWAIPFICSATQQRVGER